MKKLKLGLVLSQPFNYSLGTDARVRGIVNSLSDREVEIHLFVPVKSEVPLSNVTRIHYLPVLPEKMGASLGIYKLVRKIFNTPFLSRVIPTGIDNILWDTVVSSYASKLSGIVSRLKLDILHAQQQIAALACIKLKHKLDIPIIADLHGSLAEEMIASGAMKRESEQVIAIMQLEREICSKSDAIVTISSEMKNYFIKMYQISNEKIVVVPNPVELKVDCIEMISPPYKVVFSGMLTYRENIDLFIRSMPLVKKRFPQVEFHITGGRGEKKLYAQHLAESLGIPLRFWWFPTSDELFTFLKSCHIGVIPSTRDMARKMSYPAKLFDYLSVGLPVVANDVGVWTILIRKHKFGLVVESDPQAFAEGILNLLENPELRYNYANNGLKFLQNRSNPSNLLLSSYERLVKDKHHKEKQGRRNNN